jgi:DNA-binding transcriptional MerR regulator
MDYNTRAIATLYGVTIETIRNWTQEFERHLSVIANPGKGRHRSYSQEDMEVIDYIATCRDENMSFEEIHAGLDAGQRGKSPELPPEEVKSLVLGEQGKRLSLEVDYLQRSLAKVQQERDDALAEVEKLKEYREENIRLKAETEYTKRAADERVAAAEQRIQELSGQLKEAQNTVQELSKDVGEAYAKGVIDALERRGDLPKKEG